MTKIATAGVASCAIISLAWFKPEDRELNKEYMSLPDKTSMLNVIKADVGRWYNEVLFPIEQELGETDNYAFDGLMDAIDSNSVNEGTEEQPKWSRLKGKLILATLNEQQKNVDDGYWVERLTARGFSLIDITQNSIGKKCYVYSRNLNKREQ